MACLTTGTDAWTAGCTGLGGAAGLGGGAGFCTAGLALETAADLAVAGGTDGAAAGFTFTAVLAGGMVDGAGRGLLAVASAGKSILTVWPSVTIW